MWRQILEAVVLTVKLSSSSQQAMIYASCIIAALFDNTFDCDVSV